MAAAISPLTLLPNGILLAGAITSDGTLQSPVIYSWYLNQPGGASQLLQSGASAQLDTAALGVAPGSSVRVEGAFSESVNGVVAPVVVASAALTLPLASGSLVDVRIIDGSTDPTTRGLFREGTQLQAVIPAGLVNPGFQWYRIPVNGTQAEMVAGATTAVLTVGPTDVGSRYIVDVSYDEAGSRRVVSAPAITVTLADNGVGSLQLPASWADSNGIFGLAEGIPIDIGSGVNGIPVLGDPDGNPISANVQYTWVDALNPDSATNVVATGQRYQAGPLDAGKVLRLQAVYQDLQGNPAVTIQSPQFVIRASDNGNGQLGPISGSPTVGNTLVAGGVSGDPDTPSTLLNTPVGYQWYRSVAGAASVPIAAATAPTYVPTTSDLAAQLTVQVRTRDGQGFVSALTSNPITVMRPDSGQGLLSPIVGSPRLGSLLTAGTVNADPDGDSNAPSYVYQWQRSTNFGVTWINLPAPLGTASAYQSVAADLGAQLRVQVTYLDALNNVSTLNSIPITVVDPAGPLETLSILNSNPNAQVELGNPFNESDQIVAQLPQGFTAQSYQWYRNGAPIPGAGQSSYLTTATDAGQFTVQSYGLLNGAPRLLASPIALVQPINNAAAPLSLGPQGGNPYQVGDLLQADLGVDVDGNGATPVTFVWERRLTPDGVWESIAGAAGNTYTVVEADAGADLRARATYVDAQGFSNESISPSQQIPGSIPPASGTVNGGGGSGGAAGVGGGGGGGPAPVDPQPVTPSAALLPTESSPATSNPHGVLPLEVQIEFGFVERGESGLNQEIIGTLDDDVIGNGEGAKRMRGLAGEDGFLFDQSLTFKPGEVDTIVDFVSGVDKIFLDKSGFPGLGRISFSSVKSRKSLVKQARKGRSNVLYRRDNGSLWYDANGSKSGFGAGGQFATLENAPLLMASDIRIAPQPLM